MQSNCKYILCSHPISPKYRRQDSTVCILKKVEKIVVKKITNVRLIREGKRNRRFF